MDLEEIKNYAHKIIQININNQNNVKESSYKEAALKITLETLDNEVVRFSTEINSGFIDHQHHGNDYYLMIQNVQGLTVLYAHFFMKGLYDYEEKDNDLFFAYDFNNLTNAHLTSDSNAEYTLEHVGEKIKVQSVLHESVTGNKDPNYKAYTDIQEDNDNLSNKTESGYFPLVSRYRNPNNYSNYNAPIGDDNNDDFGQSINPQWHKNDKDMPTWEIKIPRSELGNLIQADTNDEIYPINVYINYQYLPTSTEYHQHFYGFEDVTTDCKSVNVFDNENMHTVNEHFPESTYSIINAQKQADNRYTMSVDHSNVLSIDFTSHNIYNESCSFNKNLCNEYWSYKALDNNGQNQGLFFDIQLKPNTSYVLKYYIWIPYDIHLDNNICEVSVCYYQNGNKIIIGKLHDAFISQDKFLGKQWIYHEIPFTTAVKSNQIIIKGPPTPNDEIFFTDMTVEEIIPYSPTLKYTSNELILTEQSEYTSKPNGQEGCESVPNATTNWIQKKDISQIKPHRHAYVILDDDFDIRYNPYSYEIVVNNTNTDIFNIENNYDITFTKEKIFTFNDYWINKTQDNKILLYSHYNFDITKMRCNNNVTLTNYQNNDDKYYATLNIPNNINNFTITDDENQYEYNIIFNNNAWTISDDVNIFYNGTPTTIFTYGLNNSFTLKVNDDNDSRIDKGYIECAITTDSEYNGTVIQNEVLYLGKKNVENGQVLYNNINFKTLPHADNYYLRIDYYDPCYDKTTHYYKRIIFEEEDITITTTIIPEEGNLKTIESNGEIYKIQNQEEFPIQINALISTQNGALTEGYCVLSINDEIKQSTFVNGNGIADFFLDINDLQEQQTIKIEYYRETDEMTTLMYFVIDMKDEYDIRPVVPIRFNILNNNITTQMSNTYYSISARHKDDNNQWSSDNCLLFDIDIGDENYSNYRITMTRKYYNADNAAWVTHNVKIDDNKTYKNVYEASTESIVIGDYYIPGEGLQKYTGDVIYTVTTDNIQGNNKYRPYSKSITVNWI